MIIHFAIELLGALFALIALVPLLRRGGVPKGGVSRNIVALLAIILVLIHSLAALEHAGYPWLDRFVDTLRMLIPILWLLIFDSWIKQDSREALAQNEKKYRTILADQTEWVARWQPDGTYIYVNEAYARYLGTTVDAMIGQNFLDALPAQVKREILKLIEPLSPQTPVVSEERFKVLPDGREVWQNWVNRGIFDDQGQLIAIQAAGYDITRRVQLEQALRKSEEQYRTIVENQTEFIVRCKPDGTRLFVNEAYARYYGTTPDKLIDTSFFAVLPEADLEQVKKKYAQLTPDNDTATEEHRTLMPDGSLRWHSWTDRGIFDEAGQLREVQAIGRDITAQRTAEKALRESEQRLSLALQCAQMGVWDWDLPSGRVIFDQRWCEMLGYEIADIKQHVSSWESMVHPEDMPKVMAVLNEHLEGRTPHYETEHHVRTKDGTWKWILDSGAVVERDENGRPIRAIGAHLDIHDRRRASAEIESWKNRYEAAIMASNRVMYDWNTRTGKITVAGALDRMLGCTPAEMSSLEQWTSRVHPDDLKHFREAVNRVIDEGDVFLQEYRMRRNDGTYIDTEDHGYYFTDAEGERVRMVGFLSDITERKSAERQRLKTEAEFAQKQKMEAIGHLAAGIAHDFSNLLTAIQGHLALAYRGIQQDHPARRSLKMVEQAAQQGVEMTRSITGFIHKSPGNISPCNLNIIASDSLKMFRHLLPHSVEMVLDLPQDNIPWTMASRTQLQQVAMNLILNARDAMPEGGTLTIRVRSVPRQIASRWPRIGTKIDNDFDAALSEDSANLSVDQRVAVLSVEDSGCGMDQHVLAHIFEPFFSTKDRQNGTGLGMVMVHGVVEESGGWVNVASVPGKGSRIDIILSQCEPAQETPQHTSVAPRQIPPHRPRHIVLLHQQNFVGEIMATTLESSGYVVVLAKDPETMLLLTSEHRDELAAIVVDCELLPETDDESPSLFLYMDQLPKAPLIALTANAAQFMDEPQAQQIHILPRPFQMAKLVERIDQATGIISSGAQ